jgi:large subunit ribosomal protein L22
MEAKAKQSNIKMTARKLRRVINEVRGKGVIEAQDLLRFMPYFAARVVEKNLKAAVANAKEQFDVNPEQLKISEIFADESVTYKRARPRAQGRMYSRLKRTSHLTLKVSDTVK